MVSDLFNRFATDFTPFCLDDVRAKLASAAMLHRALMSERDEAVQQSTHYQQLSASLQQQLEKLHTLHSTSALLVCLYLTYSPSSSCNGCSFFTKEFSINFMPCLNNQRLIITAKIILIIT